jgi:hypothetical protein
MPFFVTVTARTFQNRQKSNQATKGRSRPVPRLSLEPARFTPGAQTKPADSTRRVFLLLLPPAASF